MSEFIGSGTIGDPYPQSRASKFTVVLDSPITLKVGGDVDRTFDFLLGPTVWEQGPVIVSFMLVESTDDLQLQVNMNNYGYTRSYRPGPERSVHEVIGPAARLGANQLTLLVHRGSCRISDLIVWFHLHPEEG
jgi:hypothetical protein